MLIKVIDKFDDLLDDLFFGRRVITTTVVEPYKKIRFRPLPTKKQSLGPTVSNNSPIEPKS